MPDDALAVDDVRRLRDVVAVHPLPWRRDDDVTWDDTGYLVAQPADDGSAGGWVAPSVRDAVDALPALLRAAETLAKLRAMEDELMPYGGEEGGWYCGGRIAPTLDAAVDAAWEAREENRPCER